eukprot:6088719-Prorocentrum_lima.AAC.1
MVFQGKEWRRNRNEDDSRIRRFEQPKPQRRGGAPGVANFEDSDEDDEDDLLLRIDDLAF